MDEFVVVDVDVEREYVDKQVAGFIREVENCSSNSLDASCVDLVRKLDHNVANKVYAEICDYRIEKKESDVTPPLVTLLSLTFLDPTHYFVVYTKRDEWESFVRPVYLGVILLLTFFIWYVDRIVAARYKRKFEYKRNLQAALLERCKRPDDSNVRMMIVGRRTNGVEVKFDKWPGVFLLSQEVVADFLRMATIGGGFVQEVATGSPVTKVTIPGVGSYVVPLTSGGETVGQIIRMTSEFGRYWIFPYHVISERTDKTSLMIFDRKLSSIMEEATTDFNAGVYWDSYLDFVAIKESGQKCSLAQLAAANGVKMVEVPTKERSGGIGSLVYKDGKDVYQGAAKIFTDDDPFLIYHNGNTGGGQSGALLKDSTGMAVGMHTSGILRDGKPYNIALDLRSVFIIINLVSKNKSFTTETPRAVKEDKLRISQDQVFEKLVKLEEQRENQESENDDWMDEYDSMEEGFVRDQSKRNGQYSRQAARMLGREAKAQTATTVHTVSEGHASNVHIVANSAKTTIVRQEVTLDDVIKSSVVPTPKNVKFLNLSKKDKKALMETFHPVDSSRARDRATGQKRKLPENVITGLPLAWLKNRYRKREVKGSFATWVETMTPALWDDLSNEWMDWVKTGSHKAYKGEEVTRPTGEIDSEETEDLNPVEALKTVVPQPNKAPKPAQWPEGIPPVEDIWGETSISQTQKDELDRMMGLSFQKETKKTKLEDEGSSSGQTVQDAEPPKPVVVKVEKKEEVEEDKDGGGVEVPSQDLKEMVPLKVKPELDLEAAEFFKLEALSLEPLFADFSGFKGPNLVAFNKLCNKRMGDVGRIKNFWKSFSNELMDEYGFAEYNRILELLIARAKNAEDLAVRCQLCMNELPVKADPFETVVDSLNNLTNSVIRQKGTKASGYATELAVLQDKVQALRKRAAADGFQVETKADNPKQSSSVEHERDKMTEVLQNKIADLTEKLYASNLNETTHSIVKESSGEGSTLKNTSKTVSSKLKPTKSEMKDADGFRALWDASKLLYPKLSIPERTLRVRALMINMFE